MDGIDAALIRTDGAAVVEPLHFLHVPYGEGPKEMLRAAMTAALLLPKPEAHAAIDTVARSLTMWHASAVRGLMEEANVAAEMVSLIGFHGQTIAHRPDRGWTWQIGDGPMLAQMTGINVVHDFRSADVAAGGQGAPLVPVYHAALSRRLERPVAILNIGGVANVTWIGTDAQDILAFDTGPGNALIDDWMRTHTGKALDANGATAARGTVHPDVLNTLLDNPWFDAAPPKSLDRHDFSDAAVRGLSVADGAATLTAFTVEAILLSCAHMPQRPTHWLVHGGGRHNDTIMNSLNQKLGVPVVSIDAMGVDGDALEAQAFAYMAVRSQRQLPISFPGTTGVAAPQRGGIFCAKP